MAQPNRFLSGMIKNYANKVILQIQNAINTEEFIAVFNIDEKTLTIYNYNRAKIVTKSFDEINLKDADFMGASKIKIDKQTKMLVFYDKDQKPTMSIPL